MAEVLHVVEFLSVDIVLFGLIVLLVLTLSVGLMRHRRCNIGQGLLKSINEVVGFGNGKRLVVVVGVLFASQLGIIFVQLSDEILDSQDVISSRLFLYVPRLDDMFKKEDWYKRWDEEDKLKQKVLKQEFSRADFAPQVKQLLARHLPPNKDGFCRMENIDRCCEPEKKYDCAKGLFQHANAVVIGNRGDDNQREALRHEDYAVQLLSVIFVGTWILIVATFFGPVVFAVGAACKQSVCRSAMIRKLGWAVMFLVVLWFVEGAFLRLWTEQSIRYNRKLLHAYIAIASYGDPAMDIPIVKQP